MRASLFPVDSLSVAFSFSIACLALGVGFLFACTAAKIPRQLVMSFIPSFNHTVYNYFTFTRDLNLYLLLFHTS